MVLSTLLYAFFDFLVETTATTAMYYTSPSPKVSVLQYFRPLLPSMAAIYAVLRSSWLFPSKNNNRTVTLSKEPIPLDPIIQDESVPVSFTTGSMYD